MALEECLALTWRWYGKTDQEIPKLQNAFHSYSCLHPQIYLDDNSLKNPAVSCLPYVLRQQTQLAATFIVP